MKKYCKLVSCLLYWYGSQNVRFEIENGIQHFVITNYPLTVKQIMLHELSLGDIHSFCLYAFYMNDCNSM